MKISDIKPLDRLDKVNEEDVFVRHRANGRYFTCQLRNGNGLAMIIRMRPTAYPLFGTFTASDGSIPEIGLRVYEKMLSKGLRVYGAFGGLFYSRHLPQVPDTPDSLRGAVAEFYSDVASASDEINAMVAKYRSEES